MSDLFDHLEHRRAIIDRRALSDRLGEIAEETSDSGKRRRAMVDLLKNALEDGRTEINRRLLEQPSSGRIAASATAFLIDQIVRISHDFTVDHLYPSGNRSAGERITLIAVGGYGRGEMAPFSDIDIGFLTPFKQTSWTEQVIEAQLYTLWDLEQCGAAGQVVLGGADHLVERARAMPDLQPEVPQRVELRLDHLFGPARLFERGEEADVDVAVRRHFAAAVAADRDQRDALTRRAIARGIEMSDGEIVAEADELVDQEGSGLRGDEPRRRKGEQASRDFGAPIVERRLEQVDHRAAALAGVAGFGRDSLKPLGEGAAVDDRAAVVELGEQFAQGAAACFSR